MRAAARSRFRRGRRRCSSSKADALRRLGRSRRDNDRGACRVTMHAFVAAAFGNVKLAPVKGSKYSNKRREAIGLPPPPGFDQALRNTSFAKQNHRASAFQEECGSASYSSRIQLACPIQRISAKRHSLGISLPYRRCRSGWFHQPRHPRSARPAWRSAHSSACLCPASARRL